MRFIHTADWHIGRLFHNVSLLEDQAHVLEQLIEIIRDTRAEAVVVAGDVYDRAVPPAAAVRLLDEIVSRITIDCAVPLIMIAGNHDSPERLGFGSGLLEGRGFHVHGPLDRIPSPVTLADAHGAVHFYPIPYAEPAVVRECLGNSEAHSHDAAMAAVLGEIRRGMAGGRSVAISHCFVTGGETSESERPLTVGGAGSVAAGHFSGFDYVALGHLHRPQKPVDRIRYSGSLLKYSFSEVGQAKGVTLVEMDAGGECRTEQFGLSPKRDLRIIDGELEEILRGPPVGENPDDYLLVRLSDRQAILDPMGKLREVYPNILHLERPGLLETGELAEVGRDRLRRGEQELFTSFFRQMTGDVPSDAQSRVFGETVDDLRREEREAGG